MCVVGMSSDSLLSVPVSVSSDPLAAGAPALVSEAQLSLGMMHQVGARKYSSSSDTLVHDGDSQSCSSTSEPAAKPPNHTAVHGMPAESESNIPCWHVLLH